MNVRIACSLFGIGMLLTAFGVLIPVSPVEAATDLGWQGATPLDSWLEGDPDRPVLITDSMGTSWAAWQQSEGTRWNVMANSYQPLIGHWDVPTVVQNGPYDGVNPSICADGAGNVMAVWNTYDGQKWSVHWSQYLRGFGWSAGVAIDDPAGFNTDVPRVSCNDAGTAVAVWTQYDGTQWSMYANVYTPAVGWRGARHIDPLAGEAAAPQVAVDPSGDAVAVWLEWSIGKWRVASAWYESGLGWWSRTFVESNTGDSAAPSLATDNNGDAMAVWRQWDGTRWNIWANKFDEGTVNWGTAALIEASDQPVYYDGGPRVAANPIGDAFAVWTQYDGSYWNIYVNYYDSITDNWATAVKMVPAATDEFDAEISMTPMALAFIVFRMIDTSTGNSHIVSAKVLPGPAPSPGTLLEYSSENSIEPQVTSDTPGNAMAAWMQYSDTENLYSLQSLRYNVGVGWESNPMKVEFDDEGGASTPRLAMNIRGMAVSAYTRDDGPVSDVYGTIYSPATGWSPAALLEHDNRGDALDPAAGIDAAGNAVVSWRQSDGVQFDIYACRYLVGTGWSVPKAVFVTAENDLPPQVAINGAGQGFVVWRSWDGTTKRLYAAGYSTSSGWGTATLIDSSTVNDILDPVVAVDDSGNAILVDSIWDGTQYSIYAYRYSTTSGWGTATLIENRPNHSLNPQIAMNGDGRAIVAWNNLDGPHYSVYAAQYLPTTGWSPATLIEGLAGETSAARTAIDAYGDAFVTWQQWDGTMWNVFIVRYDFASGWDSPMPLALFQSTTTNPYVGTGGYGDAVVIFSEVDGRRSDTGYLYSAYARRYKYFVGWGPTELLETGAGDAWAGEVRLDGRGDAIATFLQYDGQRLNPWANRYVVGDGAPSLTIFSPTTYLTNNPTVDVAGLTDPGATVTVDGSPVTAQATGFFTTYVTLPEGYHAFVIIAQNLAGLTTSAYADVMVDLTPPTLTISSPADGSLLRTPTVTVKGTTEPLASLVVNGIDVRVDAVGSFSANVSLTEGPNVITANATDEAGNWRAVSVTVTLDSISPYLVIDSPSGGITNSPVVMVSGQTEIGASISINGTPVSVDPSGAFSRQVTLPDGTHTFVIVAMDAAGNFAAKSAWITVDTKAPALLVTSPVDGTLTRDPIVDVYGQTEPGASVIVNGLTTPPNSGGIFTAMLALREGLNTIRVTSTDPAGNTANVTLSVTVDKTPPNLAVSAPKDGTVTKNADVLVSGATDADADVTVDGVPVTVLPSGAFSQTFALPEGLHVFDIVATDPAGNTNRIAVSVTVDLTAPTITIVVPADGAVVSTPTVTVAGTAEVGARVDLNGYAVGVGAGGAFSAVLALKPGMNVITATATDEADNTASDSVTVTFNDPLPGLQQQLNNVNNALNQTRDQLSRTSDALNHTKDMLTTISDTLNQTKDQLDSTTSELANTRDTLNATTTTLNNMNNDLKSARADISGLSNVILMGMAMLIVLLIVGLLGMYVALSRKIGATRGAAKEEAEEELEEEEETEEESESK